MIDSSSSEKVVNPPVIADHADSPKPKGRLWFPVLLLAAFWAFLVANLTLDLAMFPRFMSRMIAYGILLIGFLTWWLTNRSISRGDRWAAVGVMVLATVFASLIADRSMDTFALVLAALPFAFTLWIVWLFISRRGSPAAQRVGIYSAIAISFGFFTLLRWEGLDGRQNPTIQLAMEADRGGTLS